MALSSSGNLRSPNVLEIVLMGVPAAQVDFDERDALFDQPAGHQAAAAEAGLAVAFLHFGDSLSVLKASICLLVIRARVLLSTLA